MTALHDLLGPRAPRVLVTLGSGLGMLADELADPVVVDFADVGLPAPTVPGHTGRFVAGTLDGVEVLAQQGRIHLYEGVPPRDVTAAVRAAAAAGVEVFVVTNAAGGLREDMQPGDVMVIADHLNLTGTSPLAGSGGPPQFVDMTGAYDDGLCRLALQAAGEADVAASSGVYAGLLGPAYETPAEVAMLRTLGADAVGMSTVMEVIQARQAGLRVLGLSLITNVHRAGGTPADHAEVLDAAAATGPRFADVVRRVITAL